MNTSDEHDRAISRRSMLKGGAGAVALSALLAACSSSGNGGAATTASGQVPAPGGNTGGGSTASGDLGTTSVGSNYSDSSVKTAFAAVVNGYSGGQISVNTVDHNTFQNNITTTCRAPRTTCSPGSPATACSSSPRRACSPRSTTCGRRSAAIQRRGQGRVQGPRRQVLPRAAVQLPVGGVLQQERLRQARATRSRRPGTT